MFHKHKWKEVARTYAPPFNGEIESRGRTGLMILMGVTTILWECQDENCQELRKEEMLGAESKT